MSIWKRNWNRFLYWVKLRTNRFQRENNGISLPDLPIITPSTDLPEFGVKPITGYGPVNHAWHMPESTLEKILTRMQKKNVRYFPMECVGNGEEDVLGSPAKTEQMKRNILFIARRCMELGIWFGPILFNDNIGKGNWKNGRIGLDKRLAQARAFIDWFAAQSFQNFTVVTPLGEPRTSAGKGLQSYAVGKLAAAGYRLCTNDGHRPQQNASWSQYFCYHPVSTGDWPDSTAGHVLSDTGAILAQLNQGNDVYGLGNPDAIAAWRSAGVARGQAVTAYYAFQAQTYDEASIDAMSAEG